MPLPESTTGDTRSMRPSKVLPGSASTLSCTAWPAFSVSISRSGALSVASNRELSTIVKIGVLIWTKLPGLIERGGAWQARWQPVWLGEDADLLEALASDMPAAARALTRDAETGAPDTPPRRAVESFVAATLDHLVRSHADDGLPAVPGGIVAGNVVERWLTALRIPDAHVPGDDESLRQLADLVDRDFVIPLHQHVGAELTEVLHEVVGEAVVVVDDEDHARRADGTACGPF